MWCPSGEEYWPTSSAIMNAHIFIPVGQSVIARHPKVNVTAENMRLLPRRKSKEIDIPNIHAYHHSGTTVRC
jgi:hypothetical protein